MQKGDDVRIKASLFKSAVNNTELSFLGTIQTIDPDTGLVGVDFRLWFHPEELEVGL